MSDPVSYYVYVLYRVSGEPFYVGKGKANRWLDHERKSKQRDTHKDHLIRKMQREGVEILKLKFAENILDAMATKLEIALIAALGRYPNGPLLNGTDGGEGHSNPSLEAREKLRRANLGKVSPLRGIPRSAEIKAQISAAKLGGSRSKGHRASISVTLTGRKASTETKAKQSVIATGRVFSATHRANMAEAKRSHNLSAETIAKRSAALKGRKRTAEQREKMRNSRNNYLKRQETISAS